MYLHGMAYNKFSKTELNNSFDIDPFVLFAWHLTCKCDPVPELEEGGGGGGEGPGGEPT